MKIALIGATGNVGQRIVKEATDRGHQVTAIARDPSKLSPQTGVTLIQADMNDDAQLRSAIADADVVVLSVRFQDLDYKKLFTALRAAPRVLVVGGAASLEVAPGEALIDTPGFPDFIKVEAEPARQALNWLKAEHELNWTFLSPSVFFGPGERTGKFRLGLENLLTADDGKSHISYEDYAIALLDEIETPRQIRERFTVGY